MTRIRLAIIAFSVAAAVQVGMLVVSSHSMPYEQSTAIDRLMGYWIAPSVAVLQALIEPGPGPGSGIGFVVPAMLMSVIAYSLAAAVLVLGCRSMYLLSERDR